MIKATSFVELFAVSLLSMPALSQLQLRSIPFTRDQQAIAYDFGTQKTVMHGGSAPLGAVLGDVWSRGGGAWSLETGAPGAPSLTGHALVWLPSTTAGGILLVVGGRLPGGGLSTQGPGGAVAGAFKYSGNSWSPVVSSVGPSPRTGAQMVWDPARQAAVLFGGVGSGGQLFDTWTWSESVGWTQLVGAVPPAGLIAFSPATQRVTMISGPEMKVYELFGSDWLLRASIPSGPAGPTLAYSVSSAPNAGGVLIFGGTSLDGIVWSNAMLLWNGSQFTTVAQGSPPEPRRNGRMVIDPLRNKVLLTGGQIRHLDDAVRAGDVWEFGASGWSYLPEASAPGFRGDAGLVATPGRGGMMLHGGTYSFASVRSDVWQYTGNQWSNRGGQLGAAEGYCIAYDAARDRVVRVLGGVTWEHDGQSWAVVAPAGAGPGQSGPMTYDPVRQRTVLFNGATWEWNGVTWSTPSLVAQPPSRVGGMTFDTKSSRVILVLYSSLLSDMRGIWEYDGMTWAQVGPSPDGGGAGLFYNISGVTYDAARGRVLALLNGLVTLISPTQVPALCEWDGQAWSYSQLSQPLRVDRPALAYSAELQASLMVAGADTWILSSAFPAAVTNMGPACAGSAASQASLAAVTAGPWMGEDLDLLIGGGPSGSVPVSGVIGFDSSTWAGVQLPLDLTFFGVTSCTLQVALDVVEAVSTPTWTVGIPNSPVVIGQRAYLQAFKFAPGVNPLGLVPTNGLSLTVGRL
jgi:hypothetical protein